MNDQLPFLVAPYAALAEVYERAGFADYARQAAPRYLVLAQSLDWAGRRILDIGCGTGVSTRYLAQQGFRVAGVDNNPYMLAQAQRAPASDDPQHAEALEPPEFVEMDVRVLESPMGVVDLALAVGGVMNAIQSLRELEQAFAHVSRTLDRGKLFVFDMRTIRGLASRLGDCDTVSYDNEHDLLVLARNQFSYETLSATRHYVIYRQRNLTWERQDEIHIERGYPTQGVIAMLERTGFEVVAVLDPDMRPFDAQTDPHGQAVFCARKL
jgi:SAM-dependent methyltransferase